MSYIKARAQARQDAPGLLSELVRPHRSIAGKLVLFSGIINLLTLSTSLFTMQVYDRVLSSQSKDTLFFLTLATVLAVSLSAVLEGVRQNVSNGVASWFARRLGPTLLIRSLEQRLTMPNARLEALRELTVVKNFIATPTVFNVVDMLWVPLYLVIIFLLHPWFGVVATIGAMILFGLAWYNERMTRSRVRENSALSSANMQFAESLVRNSEVIDAMGMAEQTVSLWGLRYMGEVDAVERTNALSVRLIATGKFARYMIQVLLLAIGALLVLDLDLTGGAMIAGTIIVARLLAPIDASMSYWKQFILARQALQRLDQFCSLPRPRTSDMRLPIPAGALSIEGLTYLAPGLGNPILRGVSFSVAPGEMLAIIGPSASGKTTLSRMLVGVLKPSQGHVRLDGADVFDWSRSDFGPNVGYLPQDVELLPGTVRQNIARFREDATDEEVIAAAMMADCHQMILQLDKGYDLMLGDGGLQLSGGQRQRIGLARALFRQPRFIVLDEPNSSLDTAGDAALVKAIEELKRRGITTVVVSHRANLLQLADKVLVMQEGRATKFGPARTVLSELAGGRTPVKPRPPEVVRNPRSPLPKPQPATAA
jgi:ATP-binding cassette subfamily C protein/ATP-binding cassette subfamily C exporter for protease/lipase